LPDSVGNLRRLEIEAKGNESRIKKPEGFYPVRKNFIHAMHDMGEPTDSNAAAHQYLNQELIKKDIAGFLTGMKPLKGGKSMPKGGKSRKRGGKPKYSRKTRRSKN
jgi:hypothetical protein